MNTSTLRTSLMATMKELCAGKVSVKEAHQVTKIASAINQSLRFDIENKRENIKLMKALKKSAYKELSVKSLKL